MYRRTRKIPTLAALFLLCIGFGALFYFDSRSPQTTISATSPSVPKNIHFTNITDSSFTVSWFTEKAELARLQISIDGKTFTYFDDLDSDTTSRPRMTHSITTKNLQEGKSYPFKIISGDSRCISKESCPSFEKSTSKKFPSSQLTPVRGTVTTAINKPAEDAIIYLIIGKSAPLSGRADSAGLWVIPLQNLLTAEALIPYTPQDSDPVEITAMLSPELKTTYTTTFQSLRENSIIPLMQFGNPQNPTIPRPKQAVSTPTGNTLGIGDKRNIQLETNTVQLYFPIKDGETTTDPNPRFRGIAIPGKQLLITVNSTPQTAKITVGNDGIWTWRPARALPPGEHYISVEGYDENGKVVSSKRKFIVLKSGESVLGDATSSATLTPSPTLPEEALTLTPLPSSTPTLFPSPTSELPSQTPVPTTISAPPPKTGNWQYLGLFGSLGVGFLVAGFLLL